VIVVDGASSLKEAVEVFPGASRAITSAIVPEGVYLLSAPPGGGKTEFAHQFLASGLKSSIPCIIVNTEESPDWILKCLSELGVAREEFDTTRFRVIDCYTWRTGEPSPSPWHTSNLNSLNEISIGLEEAKKELVTPRICINSITTMIQSVGSEHAWRFLQTFVSRVRSAGSHGLFLVTSGVHNERYMNLLRELFDGFLEIRIDDSEPTGIKQTVQYTLIKEIRHDTSWYPFDIGEKGAIAMTPTTHTTRDEILRTICETVTERYGFRLAWIGIVDKAKKEIVPVISKGFDLGYLQSIKIRTDDSALGRGPSGMAARTGMTALMHNIDSDPSFAPWRAEALKRGYQSSAAIPIPLGKEVIAVLSVYSGLPDGFDENQVRRLEAFADQASLTLEKFNSAR